MMKDAMNTVNRLIMSASVMTAVAFARVAQANEPVDWVNTEIGTISHMLRCDGGTTKEETLDRMRRFIRQSSEAVDICVELASRIKPAKKGLTQGEADLAAIRQMCKV